MNISRRLIIGAVIILVLLIFFTVLVGNLFKSTDQQTADTLPLPTGVNIESEGVPGGQRLDNQQNELAQKLRSKLPHKSSDFDIDYSSVNGKFYVAEKTSQAEGKFLQFLNENDLFDFYLDNGDLFVFTDTDLEQAMAEDENKSPKNPKNPQPSDKDVKRFTDFLRTLVTFDLGEGIPGGGDGEQPPSSGKLDDVVAWARRINQRIRFCSSKQNYSTLPNALSNGNYTGHSGSCVFACTYNVIDSYRLAGVVGLSDAQSLVYNMRSFWQSKGNPYKYIPYTQTQNKRDSLTQVQPGCVLMQGHVFGAEHVEVIYDKQLNSRFDGYLKVYSTNSRSNNRTYPISNGQLLGTWETPVDFGCLN